MSKYGNVRVGNSDSKKEAMRYQTLLQMQSAGQISDLRTQVEYLLIPARRRVCDGYLERKCTYRADFVYVKDGKTIVEDVKPYDKKRDTYLLTKDFIIKKKLMLERYGIEIQLV